MLKRMAVFTILLSGAAGCGSTESATGIPADRPGVEHSAASALTISQRLLPTFGGGFSIAFDVNDLGQVVGRSQDGSGQHRPFLWSESTGLIDLGSLGGCTTGRLCAAHAVNNLGQAVGLTEDANGEDRAFIWEDGVMTDLGVLPGGVWASAWNINDHGQVVGWSGFRSFFWSPGTGIVEIDHPDAGPALAINNDGVVSGNTADGDVYTWTETGGLTRLGLTGFGGRLQPRDLNLIGDFAGLFFRDDGERQAFVFTQSGGFLNLHEAGGFSDASPLLTSAGGPNERGQVAISGGSDGAWYWSSTDGFVQLTSAPGGARNGNDFGMFVGSAVVGGESRAAVWTTLSPQGQLGLVADDVASLVAGSRLNRGQGTSLTKKLEQATSFIDAGRTHPGANILQALVAQLQDLVAEGVLTELEAVPLVNAAQSVIDQIRG